MQRQPSESPENAHVECSTGAERYPSLHVYVSSKLRHSFAQRGPDKVTDCMEPKHERAERIRKRRHLAPAFFEKTHHLICVPGAELGGVRLQQQAVNPDCNEGSGCHLPAYAGAFCKTFFARASATMAASRWLSAARTFPPTPVSR
jgi:hypothetical protein